MRKLILATASQPLMRSLVEQLGDEFDIVPCTTGSEALSSSCGLFPEIALIDLSLPEIDGVEVIKLINSVGIHPKIVALTYYISDYVVSALEQYNVCSLIRLPCNSAQIVSRILDVAQWNAQPQNLHNSIHSYLAALGFKLGSGSCYVATCCIESYLQDPSQQITTQLYPAVALQSGSTVSQVEKSLRDGIQSAWKRCDEHIWCTYFPPAKNGKPQRPSNAMFISRIAECIQQINPGKELVKIAK